MAEIRVASVIEPAKVRTAAVFAATSAALAEKAQRFATASHTVASVIAVFVTPVSAVALALGLWRLGCDLDWAVGFPIETGFFSHWIVWIALAAGLKASVSLLNRPATADLGDENAALRK